MNDAAPTVSALRDRVEEDRRALEAAVADLKQAARDGIGPSRWLRERPLPALLGALALGLWLGSRSQGARGRSR